MSLYLANNNKIPFYEYLSNNPHLWDNVVGLTDTEKAFINEEFWDLDVKPLTFSRHFLHEVDKYLDQYLALKEIQFHEKLNDLVTNEKVRQIANQTATNLTRNGTVTKTGSVVKNDTHTIDSDTKEANRALPMNSSGNDLDDIVDWSKGASTASEAKTDSTDSVTGSDTISGTDVQALTDVGNRSDLGTITDKEMNEQVVKCVENIWNYLIQPKALEWLCIKLRPCFILSL